MPSDPRFHPISRDRQISESELRRISEHVERQQEWYAGSGLNYVQTPEGTVVLGTQGAGSSPPPPPGSGTGAFARNLSNIPNALGHYSARLMIANPDGTLADGTEFIWLRDANSAAALYVGEIYECAKTGSAAGRDVYTLQDFNLSILDVATLNYFPRVAQIDLDPSTNWTVVPVANRRVRLQRIMEVSLHNDCEEPGTSVLRTGPNIRELVAYPPEAWSLRTLTAQDQAFLSRKLIVRELSTPEPSPPRPPGSNYTWDMAFGPGGQNRMWSVQDTGPCGQVEIVRELDFRQDGLLIESRVWDVNFSPNDNWSMTGDGSGRVTVRRKFDVLEDGTPVSNFVWRMDFLHDSNWFIDQVALGSVTVERLFTFIIGTDDPAQFDWADLVRLMPARPNQSWDLERVGRNEVKVTRNFDVRQGQSLRATQVWEQSFTPDYTWQIDGEIDGDGRVSISRLFDVFEGGIRKQQHTWLMRFNETDFDVNAEVGAGQVVIDTEGFTGTVLTYRPECAGGNMTLRVATWTIIRGLVKNVTAYV